MSNQTPTYLEVYAQWLPVYKTKVGESTFDKTERDFNNHILPILGSLQLDNITQEMCQQYFNQWSVVIEHSNKLRTYAARVFNFAIKLNYIESNPFDRIKVKKVQRKYDDKIYTRELLTEFLAACKNELEFQYYTFFHLLTYTGLNKGEMLALTWEDVDFDKNTLRINKTISKGAELYTRFYDDYDLLNRNIPIDDETMANLKIWQELQAIYLNMADNDNNQLLFTSNKNTILQLSAPAKWIKKVSVKLPKGEITIKGFRTTHEHLLFEAGGEMLAIKERLGLSTETRSRRMMEVRAEDRMELMEKVTNLLKY
ncbi:tyrosine-type recombinase/integrase [Viridibacillus arvi]|uniref:tyrosine-type recombinase/integrase n=1 Tax=Viridibacillus arvi TaxID=263475 RepID=UPI0034CF9470